MATLEYEKLLTKYQDFANPIAVVKIGGKDISGNKDGLVLSDLTIELTSGFEASIATFTIYNSYDLEASYFKFEQVKAYIMLGSAVEISMGYHRSAVIVFSGFISQVTFSFDQTDGPCIRVTAMDIKGIMMSGSYAKQLKAETYSAAVSEILSRTAYEKLRTKNIISKLSVEDTPDAAAAKSSGGGEKKTTDRTVEMVSESDYEFVVKAAKKYNYEFFTLGKTVYFRKAKSNSTILIDLGPQTGMRNMEVQYDLTGLVEKVEVRTINAGKGELVKAEKKLSEKISQGNNAKGLVQGSEKVVIDPTVTSKEEAGYRSEYLAEDIAYRLGTLEADLNGIPELIPGRFVTLSGLGKNMKVKFYLTSVTHIMDSDRGYVTHITGKAASIDKV